MNKLEKIDIQRIIELGFQLNEEIVNYDPSNLHLNLSIDLSIKEKASLIGVTVESVLSLKNEPEKILIGSKVKTEFRLSYENPIELEDAPVDLNEQSWITMLSLAISHARAITAKSTNGSTHQNLVLPIVNPTQIFENTIKKDLMKSDSKKD